MARSEDQDLTGAEFRECGLARARLVGVVMQDAVIDGLVTSLVVNGVEVTSYVEAEPGRRHPVRLLIRPADPAGRRKPPGSCGPAGRRRSFGSARCPGARSTSGPAANGRRWRPCVTSSSWRLVVPSLLPGSAQPFTAIGLACEFVPDQQEQGLDRAPAPTLGEVLAVRDVQCAELERWLPAVTPGELSAPRAGPGGPGLATVRQGKSVLECVHVVLNEERAHHGFCVRDLDLLESPLPGAEPEQEPAAGHQAPGCRPHGSGDGTRRARAAPSGERWCSQRKTCLEYEPRHNP
jgi:DinB family protein